MVTLLTPLHAGRASQLTLSNECPRAGVSVGLWVGVDSGVGRPIVCTSGRHVRSSLGTVDVNMSRMQRQALCHISEENWEPLETTRFSKQLVPDLASCSLSVKRNKMKDKNVGLRRDASCCCAILQQRLNKRVLQTEFNISQRTLFKGLLMSITGHFWVSFCQV